MPQVRNTNDKKKNQVIKLQDETKFQKERIKLIKCAKKRGLSQN